MVTVPEGGPAPAGAPSPHGSWRTRRSGPVIRQLTEHVLPGLYIFPLAGILPWLLGYVMTGSMLALAGSLTWMGTPPERRTLRAAVESAVFLGVASFILEITLWHRR